MELISERASTIFISPNLKEGIPGLMLYQLASHNILLAVIAFIGGIFLGLISLYLVVYNALVMGVIIFQIWNNHGPAVFQSTVFLHGMIELLAFTVCVSAGFNVAKALLVYKADANKKERLLLAFKDGVKLVLFMVPFFLLAGLVETFVSNQWPRIPAIFNIFLLIGYVLLFNAMLFAYSWKQNGISKE